MFDFLCPELSAFQSDFTGTELSFAQIMISNTVSTQAERQVEIEIGQIHKQRKADNQFRFSLKSNFILAKSVFLLLF